MRSGNEKMVTTCRVCVYAVINTVYEFVDRERVEWLLESSCALEENCRGGMDRASVFTAQITLFIVELSAGLTHFGHPF